MKMNGKVGRAMEKLLGKIIVRWPALVILKYAEWRPLLVMVGAALVVVIFYSLNLQCQQVTQIDTSTSSQSAVVSGQPTAVPADPSPAAANVADCPPTGLTVVPESFDVSPYRKTQFCGFRPAVETSILMAYGTQLWELQSMPKAVREYVLSWSIKVSSATDVPLWAILAVWRSELMGETGFHPFETSISKSCAVGPGQITGPYWDGTVWVNGQPAEVWNPCKPFETNPAKILSNGCGVDFDKDGIANPFSMADNMAATACGLHHNGVTIEACPTAAQCQSVLSRALVAYLGAANTQYINAGVSWAVSLNTDDNIITSAGCARNGNNVVCQ